MRPSCETTGVVGMGHFYNILSIHSFRFFTFHKSSVFKRIIAQVRAAGAAAGAAAVLHAVRHAVSIPCVGSVVAQVRAAGADAGAAAVLHAVRRAVEPAGAQNHN